MAEIKTKITKESALGFIKEIQDEKKRKDGLLLMKLFRDVTGERPILWSNGMVGFGTYHYKSERSAQEGYWPLSAFSVRKSNLTVYIMLGFTESADLLQKLGKHTVSGGSCLYINKLEDVDLKVLGQLIKKSHGGMKKKYSKK